MDAMRSLEDSQDAYRVSIHAPVMDAIQDDCSNKCGLMSFNPRARDGRDFN